MKTTVTIDPNLPDDQVNFQLRTLTPEIERLIAQLQHLDFKLIASRNDKKYQLDLASLTTIYAQNKKVYLFCDDKQEYSLNSTLTQLAEQLPADFLRISNSEIVNAKKISHFEFTFGGKIKITFKNGSYTYSSRSYLKNIKEYFGL